MRAHSAARSRGRAARTQRTIPIAPTSSVVGPLLVGELLEVADTGGTGCVYEDVQRAVPPLSHLREGGVDLGGLCDVGAERHRVLRAELEEPVDRRVKVGLGASDDTDLGPVGREALGRSPAHALRSTLHDGRRPRESQIHRVTLPRCGGGT